MVSSVAKRKETKISGLARRVGRLGYTEGKVSTVRKRVGTVYKGTKVSNVRKRVGTV